MDWKHIKLFLIVVSGILIASLSFVLGISFGVSYEYDSLLTVLIPFLGVLGNWVAGLGALAAVFTALWLADQQRKRDAEDLNIVFSVYISTINPEPYLAVIVTCKGSKPSRLNSITIHSGNSKMALAISQLDNTGNQLPILLSYGQQATCILKRGTSTSINDFVKNNCSGLYQNLYLSINTSTMSFKTPFDAKVIEYLEEKSATQKR
ncbi:hypothetical protein [Leucothrix mucor]|uniref:hypothetical protein n=1 Tax=Leucothrix mucor TaxID=45248 RepID=UPI0003B70744|nr:hypothetical protein [Leucothrix mucor]